MRRDNCDQRHPVLNAALMAIPCSNNSGLAEARGVGGARRGRSEAREGRGADFNASGGGARRQFEVGGAMIQATTEKLVYA